MGLHYRIVRSLPIALTILIDNDYIILYTAKSEEDLSLGGEWIIVHGKKLFNVFTQDPTLYKAGKMLIDLIDRPKIPKIFILVRPFLKNRAEVFVYGEDKC